MHINIVGDVGTIKPDLRVTMSTGCGFDGAVLPSHSGGSRAAVSFLRRSAGVGVEMWVPGDEGLFQERGRRGGGGGSGGSGEEGVIVSRKKRTRESRTRLVDR